MEQKEYFPELKPLDSASLTEKTTQPKEYFKGMRQLPRVENQTPAVKPQDPFISTAKATGAHMLNSFVGQPIEDIGQAYNIPAIQEAGKSVRNYAEQVQQENPSQINSLGDVATKPVTAIKTALGNLAPQIPVSMAGAYAGAKTGLKLASGLPIQGKAIAGTLGGIAGAFAPNYLQEAAEMRGNQHQSGQEDMAKAYGMAVPAAALDTVGDVFGLGLGKFLPKGVLPAIGGQLVGNTSRIGHVAKQGAKGAGIEGGTEYGQTYLEQLGGNQDTSTEQAKNEREVSAALGALGGGLTSGTTSAFDKRQPLPTIDQVQGAQPPATPPEEVPSIPESQPEQNGQQGEQQATTEVTPVTPTVATTSAQSTPEAQQAEQPQRPYEQPTEVETPVQPSVSGLGLQPEAQQPTQPLNPPGAITSALNKSGIVPLSQDNGVQSALPDYGQYFTKTFGEDTLNKIPGKQGRVLTSQIFERELANNGGDIDAATQATLSIIDPKGEKYAIPTARTLVADNQPATGANPATDGGNPSVETGLGLGAGQLNAGGVGGDIRQPQPKATPIPDNSVVGDALRQGEPAPELQEAKKQTEAIPQDNITQEQQPQPDTIGKIENGKKYTSKSTSENATDESPANAPDTERQGQERLLETTKLTDAFLSSLDQNNLPDRVWTGLKSIASKNGVEIPLKAKPADVIDNIRLAHEQNKQQLENAGSTTKLNPDTGDKIGSREAGALPEQPAPTSVIGEGVAGTPAHAGAAVEPSETPKIATEGELNGQNAKPIETGKQPAINPKTKGKNAKVAKASAGLSSGIPAPITQTLSATESGKQNPEQVASPVISNEPERNAGQIGSTDNVGIVHPVDEKFPDKKYDTKRKYLGGLSVRDYVKSNATTDAPITKSANGNRLPKFIQDYADAYHAQLTQSAPSKAQSQPTENVPPKDYVLPAPQAVKLKEIHRATGQDVNYGKLLDRIAHVEKEINTKKTNNGGNISTLRASAIKKRQEILDKLNEDKALFHASYAESQLNPESAATNSLAAKKQAVTQSPKESNQSPVEAPADSHPFKEYDDTAKEYGRSVNKEIYPENIAKELTDKDFPQKIYDVQHKKLGTPRNYARGNITSGSIIQERDGKYFIKANPNQAGSESVTKWHYNYAKEYQKHLIDIDGYSGIQKEIQPIKIVTSPSIQPKPTTKKSPDHLVSAFDAAPKHGEMPDGSMDNLSDKEKERVQYVQNNFLDIVTQLMLDKKLRTNGEDCV